MVEMTMEPPLIEGHIKERGHGAIVIGKVCSSYIETVHAWMKDCCCRSKPSDEEHEYDCDVQA
jgi:hypothetical protein